MKKIILGLPILINAILLDLVLNVIRPTTKILVSAGSGLGNIGILLLVFQIVMVILSFIYFFQSFKITTVSSNIRTTLFIIVPVIIVLGSWYVVVQQIYNLPNSL
jgi:hypothetical protein